MTLEGTNRESGRPCNRVLSPGFGHVFIGERERDAFGLGGEIAA